MLSKVDLKQLVEELNNGDLDEQARLKTMNTLGEITNLLKGLRQRKKYGARSVGNNTDRLQSRFDVSSNAVIE